MIIGADPPGVNRPALCIIPHFSAKLNADHMQATSQLPNAFMLQCLDPVVGSPRWRGPWVSGVKCQLIIHGNMGTGATVERSRVST